MLAKDPKIGGLAFSALFEQRQERTDVVHFHNYAPVLCNS
jgi:hypothetical protein